MQKIKTFLMFEGKPKSSATRSLSENRVRKYDRATPGELI